MSKKKNAKSLYDILGVSKNATREEIVQAYATKKNELIEKRENGSIDTNEYFSSLNELDNAYSTLSDNDRRAAYDNSFNPDSPTGAKKGKASGNGKGKKILVGLAVGAVVIVLGVSLVAGISELIRGIKGSINSDQNNQYVAGNIIINESSADDELTSGTKDDDEDPSLSTSPDSEDEDKTDETSKKMVNYGNATDDKLVTERATALLDDLNDAGLYNMGTNAPYTVDEIKTLIQYMNGAYKPQSETEAYTMVNEVLNFALAPLNSEHVLFAVQYHGGEDSFKETVEGYISNFHRVNIVDNMLMGNSTAYPYLKWFEDQYNAMLCTTDREKCAQIYDSMMQSLADMVYGDGFTLNGKTYNKNDFLGLDRVNSGNILQILVYMMEPFRTDATKNTFTVTNSLVSGNSEENKTPVTYLQITEHFNALCEDDLHGISFDDEGYLLIDQPDGKNFAYINQVNTINMALRMYYGNTETYTSVYQKGIK